LATPRRGWNVFKGFIDLIAMALRGTAHYCDHHSARSFDGPRED
jgi:hypothetical protein